MNLAPSPAQVERVVARVRKKAPGARRIGIHFSGTWNGPEKISVDGESFRVAHCVSTLAVREALSDDDDPLVILTDRSADELGLDAMARLAKRKLHTVDPWQVLLDLFAARELDRRLQRERWLVDALLEAASSPEFPVVSAGFLDFETAWETFLRLHLGLSGPADARGLLAWFAASGHGIARFRSAAGDLRTGVRRRIVETAGDLAGLVLDAIASGADPISVGLSCRVLYAPASQEASGLREARVRLEPLLGGAVPTPLLGQKWADEAEAFVKSLPDVVRQAKPYLDAADDLLLALKGESGAFLSDLLPAGFEQRLARFGEALKVAASGKRAGNVTELQALARSVARHQLARTNRERAEAVEMAMRLVRWLEAPPRPHGSAQPFHEAVEGYVASGSFVDWARERLTVAERPGLADAYRSLANRVGDAREKENEAFGTALAAWSLAPAGSPNLCGVEDVLDRVIAPLAEKVPVLLVVLDGMSYPIFREILTDLGAHGWFEAVPAEATRRLTVVATVPSVTEYSRASLLSGALRVGSSNDEKQAFPSHPALLAACKPNNPPLLFHKAGLMGPGGIGIDEDLQEKVAKAAHRIVSVVLNAVDDHLHSGDQVHPRWGLDYLKGLRGLLDEASRAGRYVVLTADHGHVLERDRMEHRPSDSGGERYRMTKGGPSALEVAVSGPRLDARYGERVVVPWSERLRYGRKKNGYHGGASPQEIVVALSVLTQRDPFIEGWQDPSDRETPPWWDSSDTSSTVQPRRSRAASAKEGSSQPDLFSEVPSLWVDRLLQSPRFKDQRDRSERAQLQDVQVRKLLEALSGSGGQSTLDALERRVGVPAFRLKSVLVALRKLLNVDGYSVLTIDEVSRTASLNRELLDKQFELGPKP